MNDRGRRAVEHAKCPTCHQARGSMCVGARVPDRLRNQPSSRQRVEREGRPLAQVHRERYDELARVERAQRTADQLAAQIVAARSLTNPAAIAHAEREHDRREAGRLVQWLCTGGAALLLSAPRLATVPADLDGGECPECDAPVELLHSGVRCTSCAWWYCA